MSIEEFEATLKCRLVREFSTFESSTLYVSTEDWSNALSGDEWRTVMMYLHGGRHDQYMQVLDLQGLDACLMKFNINTKIYLQAGWIYLQAGWWGELTVLRVVEDEH